MPFFTITDSKAEPVMIDWPDQPVAPRADAAVGIQRGFDAVVEQRAVVARLHVVLAHPHQLDRRPVPLALTMDAASRR